MKEKVSAIMKQKDSEEAQLIDIVDSLKEENDRLESILEELRVKTFQDK